jgi:hypothetical protein
VGQFRLTKTFSSNIEETPMKHAQMPVYLARKNANGPA